ncbi:MAG: RtcB family protein [Myxococcales bacterium]|nr:RtcB family protein [Myxococcales bacterium]
MTQLLDEAHWKQLARDNARDGYYALETRDTAAVPVRLFLTPALLNECEPTLYRQIVNATHFPGVKQVCITPDVHYGYGVPVGSVLVTSRDEGCVAMGPVGFDIGCGMMSARSEVPAERATFERRLAFNREVEKRVSLGAGGTSLAGALSRRAFEEIVRGGAEHYLRGKQTAFSHDRAERQRLPVRDTWDVPWDAAGRPDRGREQLGTLGGGNHFIELQRGEPSGTLFVQVHTGSRGFGHGLATHYFERAREELPALRDIDLGYFRPESKYFLDYLDAVSAGANFAIVNRLMIFEHVAEAFYKVFRAELSLVYEISHNLVQAEEHPELGPVWTHRKGATRAFPAGHPALRGTCFEREGHPVLIPGSNRDKSFILRPEPGALKSAYSVNHGAGRRLSRGEASRTLSQEKVNEQYRHDGIVVNTDLEVPLDESGACYKPSDEVINAVVSAGLARIEETLYPLASLKANEALQRKAVYREHEADKKARDKAREAERRQKRR